MKEKRDQYWQMLYRARQDFLKLMNIAGIDIEIDMGGFGYFLKEKYGFQPELIDGSISANYIITDEKKYTMFLLKYGS